MVVAAVALLLPVMWVVQYRWIVAVAEAERRHVERGWNEAAAAAAASVNRSVSELYTAIVTTSQQGELGDVGALQKLIERWKEGAEHATLIGAVHARRAADGTWVGLEPAGARAPSADLTAATLDVPFAATWLAPADPRALPSMIIRLDANGSAIDAVRLGMSAEGCRRTLASLTQRYFPEPSEDVRLAIVHASSPSASPCADDSFRVEQPPEATAGVFRLVVVDPSPLQGAPAAGVGVAANYRRPGGPGWELWAQRRGQSVAETAHRAQRRNVALAAATELLLVAAFAAILVGSRRARRTAEAHHRFAAAVAHELRTPLASIKVLAQNQARGILRDGAQVEQYGRTIGDEAERLHAFVERLLQFSGAGRVDARMSQARLDPGRLVDAAVAPLRQELEQRGLTLTTSIDASPAELIGDEAALTVALRNLVQNVLDHAANARTMSIDVRLQRRDWILRVSDDGPGVPAAEQSSLFEPFTRGRRSRGRRVPGHGLGLAIVRDIVSMHGGKVWYEARKGGGAVFSLRLPSTKGRGR